MLKIHDPSLRIELGEWIKYWLIYTDYRHLHMYICVYFVSMWVCGGVCVCIYTHILPHTHHGNNQIRSDQSLSHVRLFATPWIAARQNNNRITNITIFPLSRGNWGLEREHRSTLVPSWSQGLNLNSALKLKLLNLFYLLSSQDSAFSELYVVLKWKCNLKKQSKKKAQVA